MKTREASYVLATCDSHPAVEEPVHLDPCRTHKPGVSGRTTSRLPGSRGAHIPSPVPFGSLSFSSPLAVKALLVRDHGPG